jgi:short subunit dehydrogenase-like uncharacterized protein
MKKWLIYGVGKTGSLIAQEALQRGHSPLLAGRSAGQIKPVAERLGLDWAVAELSDESGLSNLVEQADLVVNTAGPFLSTSLPMVQVCLAKGKHYLDISNEIPVFQSVLKLDEEAQRSGVALIPGVGFGVAATDGLAHYVAGQIKNPKDLEIAVHIYSRESSASADITRLEALARGGWVRRNGALLPVPLGRGGKRLKFPDGEKTILPIPLGDLETAYHSTGVPNITTYGTFSIPPTIASLVFPVMQRIISNAGLRQKLEGRISQRSHSSIKPKPTQASHSYAWAHAKNERGESFEAWQEMGEGYDFTARSVVRAVEEVFREQMTGALTPSQAFGSDFALRIDGTRRYNETKG